VAMRVVSWNIDARGDGLRQRVEQLASFDADVLLLQEVPRRAAPLLAVVSGSAWAELSVLHSEPSGGPSTRLGTAILARKHVQLRSVGQIPEQRFIAAGLRAGLSESEVRERTGWLHRNLYADVEIDGTRLRVCSLHARPATGGAPGRPPLGYTRQVFHRVCAAWLAEHDGTALFGVDANGPFIDHPEPDRWQPAMAGDATLIGPQPEHHLTDAMYRWLADRPEELEAIRHRRPDGPLAVSYVTTGSKRPCRYDHVYITDDISVENIQYRSPYSDGSDHGAVVADLAIRQP
jgi:hypothetical protein